LLIAPRSTFIAIAWPVRSDVSRWGLLAYSTKPASRLPITWDERSSSPAFSATSTRTRRLAVSTCRGRRCKRRGSLRQIRARFWRIPRSARYAPASSSGRKSTSAKQRRSWRKAHAASCGRRGSWARPIASSSRHWWRAALRRRGRPFACRASNSCSSCCAISCDAIPSMTATVHIIGAGLAGLSAALKLSARGARVILHEATAFAGGRCRSYYDASVGMTIDNGNHLLLSGNRAALDYLRSIGAEHRLVGPPTAEFCFFDLASRERWTLRFNNGRLPFWILDPSRRVLGTRALDYLPLARLLWAPPGKAVGEVIACDGLLYRRLVEPLLLAALNIDAPQGSARLAAAIIRETLAAGGRACRPLIAREGLGSTLIEPALIQLQQRGATVRMEHQLRALRFGAERVEALDFGSEAIALDADDAAILTVPPYAAASLVRGLDVPTEFRAIVNAHFRIEPPAGQPPI